MGHFDDYRLSILDGLTIGRSSYVLVVIIRIDVIVVITIGKSWKRNNKLKSISNTKGPKDVAPFHLLLIFDNANGFEM